MQIPENICSAATRPLSNGAIPKYRLKGLSCVALSWVSCVFSSALIPLLKDHYCHPLGEPLGGSSSLNATLYLEDTIDFLQAGVSLHLYKKVCNSFFLPQTIKTQLR